MTFSKMTFSIMVLSIATFSIMTLSIMTSCIFIFSHATQHVGIQHNYIHPRHSALLDSANTLNMTTFGILILSITTFSIAA